MKTAYPVSDVRRMEEAAIAADPTRDLMQIAARALSSVLVAELTERRGKVYGSRVVILVGAGNNGGDALYAGAQLARRGAWVAAVPVLGTPHPGGVTAFRAAGGRVVDLDQAAALDLSEVDLAVDGIIGIGGRPGLPDAVAELASRLTRAAVPIVAVDLPSGVDADTGAVPGAAIRAACTVSFGAAKVCEMLEPAKSHCGRVVSVDLGFRPDSNVTEIAGLDEDDLAYGWPYPDARSSKYVRGVVGIDAGSPTYPGAAVLATHGAVHAGAGMVRFLGAAEPGRMILAALPNVVRDPGRVQAWLFGPGWGERRDGAELIAKTLAEGLPTVVDADGLRRLPTGGLSPTWLLTPHAGELARLLGIDRADVEADPIDAARRCADRTGATVLLKGATQVVAQPGRRSVMVALQGPAWTAQAGSGDVLSGICATLLAARVPAPLAGALAASLQAATAAACPGPLPPQELARQLANTLGRLERRRSRS